MSKDVRTIVVKLADRLQNMRTLFVHPEEKQKRIAKETLEILAPIAHRLGINKIKGELEDLCLKYLYPDRYLEVVKKLNKTKAERDKDVKEMMESVSKILKDNNIVHEIKGRSKSIYSIYTKMQDGRKFEQIYDLLAIRILVSEETDCYIALGLIHSKYKPLSNRFKDYIAQPKTNMYQSLHTTVFGVSGSLFEIQIRTNEMNEIAEYGIASHTSYKENTDQTKAIKSASEKKILFFREILELQDEYKTNKDFIDEVKQELFGINIYVHTPKGDVIELPKGSTPIDFAYKVHTEVGNKMIGAIVNNNIVPLDYELSDGDIIKINTLKTKTTPNKDWINMAKTSAAKNKIRSFFIKNIKAEKQETGEKELLNELRKRDLSIKEFLDDKINIFIKEQKLKDLDDLYYQIGNRKYSVQSIVNSLTKEKETKEENVTRKVTEKQNTKEREKNDIIIEGIENIKINLANCCSPVFQDEIIGYITKTNGITVHRIECENIKENDRRVVNASWNNNIIKHKSYCTKIIINSNKTKDPLVEIIAKCQNYGITIDSIKNINNKEEAILKISIYVKNKEVLDKFLNELNAMKSINSAKRLIS